MAPIILYLGDDLDKYKNVPSVYLDGPLSVTVGKKGSISWRKKLIETFTVQGFNHVVIIPECKNSDYKPQYTHPSFYEWEEKAMKMATIIMFWIPRESGIFVGRDINDRWGQHKLMKNVILGHPSKSEGMDYQDWYSKRNDITVVHHLENMVQYVVAQLNQYADLSFDVQNGHVYLPTNEEILNNIWLGKMIERMGMSFTESVEYIHVPFTNTNAIATVITETKNSYQPSSANSTEIVLQRMSNWENRYNEPANTENVDNLQDNDDLPELLQITPSVSTISPASAEKMEQLAELRRKLRITDNDF